MVKVLIVDDAFAQREQLKNIITDRGYEVLEACDGQEGFELAIKNKNDIALIICDFNMPVMDGISMCKKIKEENILNVPIFMITTESSLELKELGKSVGKARLLLKK